MKAVMKKIFCLMLVAVLLVSAVPTAFAAAPTCDKHPGSKITRRESSDVPATCTEAGKEAYKCAYKKDGEEKGHVIYVEIPAGHTPGAAATCEAAQTCTVCGEELAPKLDHTPGAAATCSAPQTCTVCGEELAAIDEDAHKPTGGSCTTDETCALCGEVLTEAPGHTPSAEEATCTTAVTCTVCGAELEAALGHKYGEDGECENGCGSSETNTHEVYFSVNGNQNYWHLGVAHGKTVADPGFSYGTDYHYLEKVGDTDTQKFMGWSKNPSDTTGSKLEDIVQVPVKESVVYYAIFQAKESSNTGSGNSGSNNSGVSIPSGKKSLKVWAKVWVGEVLHDTILLDTITGLSADAKVYQVIAANKDRLESKFPEGYYGTMWHETVYYKVDNNKTAPVDTLMTVGEENDVFINLYTGEKLVVVNVHTSKSYHVDLNVRIKGFRVGDVVTYDDVLKAVKKYYNVSSMDMYSYGEFEKVIAGKSANKTPNFKVTDGDNVYEVLLSGSRKSGTYTYTADASNPKTGDAIYTPVIVMGASVTALAVLFFLNKKRSII